MTYLVACSTRRLTQAVLLVVISTAIHEHFNLEHEQNRA